MARCLSAVAAHTRGRLTGDDAEFGIVGTDTRSLAPGSLFVAIRGERFDGNRFVAAAAERGAVGAVVSQLQDVALPQIEVDDTRRAFGEMAHAWRANFDIPVVAVTGSAGKTTVKELVGSILRVGRRVCVTEGSLNNDIGVPLSLMRLDAADEALVVELGANHAGEIAALGALVEPTVAVITNAAAAHLEGFGSLNGVATAKGELIDALPEDGVAVLNADDRYFDDWCRRAGNRRVLSFGFGADADFHPVGEVELSENGSRFAMVTPAGERIAIRLGLLGRANVANALAAAAAASAAGATPADVEAGLSAAAAVRGRMRQIKGLNGASLIDDSYNANPSAARAALEFLGGCSGHRIFVLGDMLELGESACELHREVGKFAVARCDELVAIGELAAEAAMAFGSGATTYTEIAAAAAALRERMEPNVTVLVKASRSVGLDRLVSELAADSGNAPC